MGSQEDDRAILEEGLLQNESSTLYTGDGSVDFHGNPVLKQNTGNWKACPFILGNEGCERLAYYGISTNLVTYLTNKLHQGNVSAARNVTTWQGTCYLTPLIGAILADAYWGRYWTIAAFSTIYFIGMCTLTLSASVPALKPAECVGFMCPPASAAQYMVFFLGLYLIALGTGGIKPCVSSFGADQFDDTDPAERVKKGSFFNWFYFSINIGALISSSFLVWIQDNAGWGLGFGIPAVFMGLAIVSFFSGTKLYRFQKPGGSPITRMCQVLVASFHKRNLTVPSDSNLLYEVQDKSSAIEGSRKLEHSDELRCLDKAAVISDAELKSGDFSDPWRLCTCGYVIYLAIYCVDNTYKCLKFEFMYNASNGLYTGNGSVDFNGNLVLKQNTGNWKACPFILRNEGCERLAYCGISVNLVTYLTNKPHQGSVSAARNVTTWQGTCYLAPLIGAILADAYWGRYWTIAAFSTIYFIVCFIRSGKTSPFPSISWYLCSFAYYIE
ncbi:hypothetical protein Csa_017802 [Cucumis sativus]|nr:hypothetical protein Csa_017802 [Cucumis sativus]